jgi:hypothetical protein
VPGPRSSCCALLYRDLRRGALLASAIVVAFAFFGHLADQAVVTAVPELLQLIAWAAFVLIAALVALRARGSLPTATATLNAFGLALVVMTLGTILPAETSRAVRASEGEPVDDEIIAEATRHPDRDIYFLVFDRYGSDWSLEHSFGWRATLPTASRREALRARAPGQLPRQRLQHRHHVNMDVARLVEVGSPRHTPCASGMLATRSDASCANGYGTCTWAW